MKLLSKAWQVFKYVAYIGLVVLMVVYMFAGEYQRATVYGLMLVLMELQDISAAILDKSVE